MIQQVILQFIHNACFMVWLAISEAIHFVIALVGPGLLTLIAAVAILWYFGWLGAIWGIAASYF